MRACWEKEIPEGKPTITAAHNTSATSIYLAWKPPSRDTIHGEFLGYRIGYRRREKADEEMKNIYIRDPAVDNHSIHNLDTFTQYLVSLQVFNPEGHGPASTVTVMTDEGAQYTRYRIPCIPKYGKAERCYIVCSAIFNGKLV
ncbi:Protein sidekick [Temnothorax longispinosus]|uniref:Protein sidekick n=1 Tax=Temnothorax longispinosus TaxID=300112 RepID=A0A4S2JDU0_9HYME|nr:Protein sidekick [Temnothorax longispinosus]